VYPLRGIIDNPHTLPGWEHWNIVDALVGELGLPVWLENDADAAALGEYHHGAGHRADCLVMLTFGTGVGGAVLSRGRIFRGASGGHPEIGHMPIAFSGVRCYCGRKGCLESTVSGPAIAAFGQKGGFAGAAEVFAAAKEDASARDILATVRGAIEAAIWTLVHVYCPARIVLGGGLVEAYPQFFLEAARNAARGATLISQPPVAIAAAQLGNRAGLVGAACWALECHAATRRTASQVTAPVNSAPS
jgi:glucokinase